MGLRIGNVVMLAAAWATASVSAAQSRTYRVDTEKSRLVVHVGRSGIFKMFGHDHVIRVDSFAGSITWDAGEPESSSFALDVDAASLRVDDDELSDDDRETVQSTMETDALRLQEHGTIAFASSRVTLDGREGRGRADSPEFRLKIAGELTLRGVRAELEVPLTLTREGDELVAVGRFELDSKKWGVPRISALGGSVKTENELGIELRIVASP